MNFLENILPSDKKLSSTRTKKTKLPPVHPNHYFEHIYLINLRKRPDRLLKVLQKLRSLNIQVEVINAINGNTEPYLTQYRNYLKLPIMQPHSHPIELKKKTKIIKSPGAWGYLLTWKRILMDARKHNYRNFLSLDDDVLFHKDFLEEFSRFTQSIPPKWILTQLGATQLPHLRPSTKSNYYHPLLTDGSFATGIDRTAYPALLTEIQKMNAPVDSGPLRALYQLYPEQCYVADPHLIIADVGDSDITTGKNLTKIAEKLEWNLALYDLKPLLDKITIVLYTFLQNQEDHKRFKEIFSSFLQKIRYPNIEWIIVDDSSLDPKPLREICRKLDDKYLPDQKIKLILNPWSVGPKVSKDIGYSKSHGKYLTFLDLTKPIRKANKFFDQLESKLVSNFF